MGKLTPRAKVNKALSKMSRMYWNEIPLRSMFLLIEHNGGKAVQEDGSPWSGLLCGMASSCSMEVTGIKGVHFLCLAWYTMGSGRYEITAYLT